MIKNKQPEPKLDNFEKFCLQVNGRKSTEKVPVEQKEKGYQCKYVKRITKIHSIHF